MDQRGGDTHYQDYLHNRFSHDQYPGSLVATNYGFTIISNQVFTLGQTFAPTGEVRYFHINFGVINTDPSRSYYILQWPELPLLDVFPASQQFNGVGTNEYVVTNHIIINTNPARKMFFWTKDAGPAQ